MADNNHERMKYDNTRDLKKGELPKSALLTKRTNHMNKLGF